jgi:PAS domain S-box-containing protein
MTTSPAFLAGGGEMGALIRAYPWTDTALGPPDQWAISLQYCMRLMLNSSHPMNIFWGPQALFLYNDAYRTTLDGDRHPPSLGQPGEAVWPETWPLFASQIDQVMQGGGSVYHENQAVHFNRRGQSEERCWTYSFSPIADGNGCEVGGVLVICTETTQQVLAARRHARENEKRYDLFQRLPGFIGILRGPDHVYEYVNDAYMSFAGPRELIGRPVREPFPDLQGQGFFEMLDGVYATGVPVILRATPIKLFGEDYVRYIDLRYDPTYDETGAINGIFVSGYDLTDRVQAEARRESLALMSEQLRNLTTPSDIALAASKLLGETLQISRAGYGTIDAVSDTLHVEREWDAPGIEPLPAIVSLRDYGAFVDDLKLGDVVTIADVTLDARTVDFGAAFEARSARAFANIPVVEQGELVALLYLNHAEVRNWSDEDIAFIQEVAERTRTAVERSRSDVALRALTDSLEQQVDERTRERDRLWETSEDLLAIAGYHGELFRISPSWTRLLGHDEQDLLSRSYMDFIHPDDMATVVGRMGTLLESCRPVRFQNRFMAADGTFRWIAWSLVPEIDVPRVNAVGRDITADRAAAEERVRLEEQLRQSQKMEAVGQLTGGIAHDFNNMIQGVTGSLQIASRRLAAGRTDEIGTFMADAITSADRAAALTHRLLAFSRRQPLDPRPLDANQLIGSLTDLFRRTIGGSIFLNVIQADGLWMTRCDANQLESSLLNLVINARDAMPEGGTLTIETRNADLDVSNTVDQGGGRSGRFLGISVTDTGVGMDPDTIAKAFDPFFTTKPIGQGTGLGLSMVYGFALQSEGFARISSALGEGTTVTIYLPRHSGDRRDGPPHDDTVPALASGPGKTILIIDDDAIVHRLVVTALRDLGYATLGASDGAEGLALLKTDIHIDLLVTDIGLPGLNGRQVAEAARVSRPDLPILFMTGYADNATFASGFLGVGMRLITKPFAVEDLTERIRAMIAK